MASNKSQKQVHHINALPEDLQGNDGRGRYVFLPGSPERAEWIAGAFDNVVVNASKRGHHLYLGTLASTAGPVAAASVASGMGVGSLEIIVTELLSLGARRFLRVGTAGSLQPDIIQPPAMVIATAAVRDEGVSGLYAPLEVPAIASPEMSACLAEAARKLGYAERTYSGMVHTKDALFAREFGAGPQGETHLKYIELLSELGVLASEMESSALFMLGTCWGKQIRSLAENAIPAEQVLMGSLQAIIGDGKSFSDETTARETIEQAINVAVEGIRLLAQQEKEKGG